MAGPIKSGALVSLATRTTAAADTAHPNFTNPTAPMRPALSNVARGKSRDAWVAVYNAAADAGVSVTVTLYGSMVGDGTVATAGSWRVIGQLNSASPIVPATKSALTVANRIYYAEAVPGLLAWNYVWATVTGTLAQNTTVDVLGEE